MGESSLSFSDQLKPRVVKINLKDLIGEPPLDDDPLQLDEYLDIYGAVLRAMGIETVGQLKAVHDCGSYPPTAEQRRRFVAEMTAMDLSAHTSIFPIDLQIKQGAGTVKLNPYYTYQYDNTAKKMKAFAVFYNETANTWLGLSCRETDNVSQFEVPNTTTPEWASELVKIEDGEALVDFLITQREAMTGVSLSDLPTSD